MANLTSNTASLQEILAKVNALPETGSGGGGLEYEDRPAYTYTVDAVSGASYGFAQNSAGYWESQNKGANSSYALCRVNFNVQETCNIAFDVINYAEGSYDYGLMGIVDEPLAKSASADSSVYKNFKTLNNASAVLVTYNNVPAGSHFIDVKFIKDSSSDSNNDSIQFKVQASPVVRVFSEETTRMLQEADSNFVANNIKSGVSIFGVAGSDSGSGGNVETCGLTVIGCKSLHYSTVENGEIVGKTSLGADSYATHNVTVCLNTNICCATLGSSMANSSGATQIAGYSRTIAVFLVTEETASIDYLAGPT